MNKNILFQLSNAYSNEQIQIDSNVNQEELFGQVVLNKTVGIAYDKIGSAQLHRELKRRLIFCMIAIFTKVQYLSDNLNT